VAASGQLVEMGAGKLVEVALDYRPPHSFYHCGERVYSVALEDCENRRALRLHETARALLTRQIHHYHH